MTRDWPPALHVTAIDANTGELHVFDHRSGAALIDAVSASGAVSGIWPLERIGDNQGARAVLIAPDEQTVRAIGANPYDPGRCRPAAKAGRAQGATVAANIAAIWLEPELEDRSP